MSFECLKYFKIVLFLLERSNVLKFPTNSKMTIFKNNE